jgi:PAS domain-containing protein
MKFFSGSAQHHRDNMLWQATFERSCDAILVLSGAKIIACNEAAVRFGGYRARRPTLRRSYSRTVAAPPMSSGLYILGDRRRSRPGVGAHQRSGQQPRGGGGQDRRRHRHDQRDREPG